MTSETRTYIAPADVVAIEFECRRCQAKIEIPIESTANISTLPATCPHCREDMLGDDSRTIDRIRAFLFMIRDTNSGLFALGANVRLRLAQMPRTNDGDDGRSLDQ